MESVCLFVAVVVSCESNTKQIRVYTDMWRGCQIVSGVITYFWTRDWTGFHQKRFHHSYDVRVKVSTVSQKSPLTIHCHI